MDAEQPIQKKESASGAASETSENNDKSQPSSPLVAPPPKPPVPTEYKPDPYQEKNYRLTKRQFCVATTTLVVLGVYTGIAGYQGLQMKRATDAAKESSDAAAQQVKLMRQQLVGTQAAALKFSTSFNMQGFEVGFANIHDVAAIGTHVTVRMTPVSLPKGLPLGSSVMNEATVPRIEKDKPFSRQWPVPWPQQEFRGQDWPGKRAVRAEGTYSYDDGFGNKVSQSFCTVWLPRFNIVMKAENAYGGGPVECEGLESTIRDVWARMKEAAQEKKSPN